MIIHVDSQFTHRLQANLFRSYNIDDIITTLSTEIQISKKFRTFEFFRVISYFILPTWVSLNYNNVKME